MLFFAKTLVYIDSILLIAFFVFRSALAPSFKGIIHNRILAIVLLTPVVALFCRNIYIFYAYLFVVAAFGARTKSDLCALYLVLITLCPSLGVSLSAGSVYLVSITVIHIINLGALLAFFITPGKVQRGNRVLDLLIWVPVVLFALTAFWDYKIQSFLRLLVPDAIMIVVPYFFISRLIRNREDLNKAMIHFMLAAFLASAIAIFEALRMWPLYEAYAPALNLPTGLSKTLAVRSGAMRAVGPFLDYTALGLFLAVALSIVPAAWQNFGPSKRFGVLAAIGMGLLATQSRGAWVGAAVGLAVVMVGRGRLGVVIGSGAAAACALMARSMVGGKVGPIGGEHGAETAEYRIRLLERGMQEFMKHPLFGQNRSVLEVNMADLVQGQGIIDFVNSHLNIALVSGVVGLSLWCAMWLVPMAMAWRVARLSGRSLAYPAALLPPAMLVTAFVALIFTSMIDRNLVWVALGLGLVAPCIAATREEAAGRAGREHPGRARPSRAVPPGRQVPRPAILLPR